MKQTFYRKAKSEKRRAKNEKRKTKSKKRKTKRILTLTKWTSAYDMSCLIDVKHSLTFSLTHSLIHSLIHVLRPLTVTSCNIPMIEKRKTKSEKRKAKNEKRKTKNKKNLHFDKMNVCIWNEQFDWRKTLTHFLTYSLAHSHTHSLMYPDTKQ